MSESDEENRTTGDGDELLRRIPMQVTETEESITFEKRDWNWGSARQQLGEFIAGIVAEEIHKAQFHSSPSGLEPVRCGRFSVDTAALNKEFGNGARPLVRPIVVALLRNYRRLRDAHDFHPAGGSPSSLQGLALGNIQAVAEEIALRIFPGYRISAEQEKEWEAKLQAKEKATRKKVPIPKDMRKAVFERDGFACIQCGSKWELAADHIHPESKGGATILSNMQTLCKSCNSKKHAKMPTQPA